MGSYVLIGLGAGVFALLILFIWVGTHELSAGWKWLVRTAVAAVAVVPLTFAVLWTPLDSPSPTRSAEAPSRAERNVAEKTARPAEPDGRLYEAPAKTPPLAGSRTETTRSAVRGLTPVPGSPDDRWHVVPVFFGTDRAKDPLRVVIPGYNAERGKRLELGRALVSIPKQHQVPDIERPWVYKLPFTKLVIYREKEDPQKHFTLRAVQVVDNTTFIDLIKRRLNTATSFADHMLVFVHGFNTSFDDALYRTAQIAYDLKFDGAPLVYSWPSKGEVTSYSYDRESAGQAEPYLKQFLRLATEASGAKNVHIIAHSMGNQLLLPVLRSLKDSLPQGLKLAQIILAAPDVDRDAFEFLAAQIKGVSRGVTLYANANDRALAASRQFWGGPRAGDVPASGPVIVAGVDTIDVSATSSNFLSLNHSGYARNKALLNDIQLILQTGERPPEKRIPILERITTPRGDYWRYPGAG
ncbi:MAG: alpha/beta hydrolase [Pseudomonadota bacterium]